MSDRRPYPEAAVEVLREALDDSVLRRTGRSIGDLTSAYVAKDGLAALEAGGWLHGELEQIGYWGTSGEGLMFTRHSEPMGSLAYGPIYRIKPDYGEARRATIDTEERA